MSAEFEQRVEAGLEALATASAPPPPDLYDRVRAKVDRRRRRRTAVLLTGVAACTATVLGLTLALSDGSAAVPPTTAASGGAGGVATAYPSAVPTPTPTPTTDLTWWPLADASLPSPPAVVGTVWDASAHTVHSDVRLLLKQALGNKLALFLVAGRTADGQPRTALLAGEVDTHGVVVRTGLSLLLDLPAPADPSAPVALALTVGLTPKTTSTLDIDVRATPCDGKEQLTLGADSTPVGSYVDSDTGALIVKPLKAGGVSPSAMTLRCAAPATGTSTVVLKPVGHAVVPGWDAGVSLLTSG